jgi:hypothetical protein
MSTKAGVFGAPHEVEDQPIWREKKVCIMSKEEGRRKKEKGLYRIEGGGGGWGDPCSPEREKFGCKRRRNEIVAAFPAIAL